MPCYALSDCSGDIGGQRYENESREHFDFGGSANVSKALEASKDSEVDPYMNKEGAQNAIELVGQIGEASISASARSSMPSLTAIRLRAASILLLVPLCFSLGFLVLQCNQRRCSARLLAEGRHESLLCSAASSLQFRES